MNMLLRAVWLLPFTLLLLPVGCGGSGQLDESLTGLEVGDCIDGSGDAEAVETVEAIDCDDPDAVQVIKVFDITGHGDEYPGQEAIDEAVSEGCPATTVVSLYPTKESWEQGDDREVVCFAPPALVVGDDDDDGGDAGGDSGDFDVCGLLTDAEVSEALEAEMTHNPSLGSCDWEATAFDEIKFLVVDVILDDAQAARQTLEATAVAFGEDAVQEVDGVGDRAVVSEQIGLEILTDDDYLRVDVYGSGFPDEELNIERQLAELALGRLP